MTRADIAAALTGLRLRAGLSIRALASLIDERPATVGGYFSGRHLPVSTRDQVLRTILQACGVGDEAEVERWLAAVERARRSPVPRTDDASQAPAGPAPSGPLPAPYRGLAAFGEDDAALFFGREALLGELLQATGALDEVPPPSVAGDAVPRPALGRALVVTGASGSGKSSLVRAALVPSIRAERLDHAGATWTAHVVRPSDGPDALTLPPPDPARRATVYAVVVDQAEELFTALTPEQRRAYLDRLAGLLASTSPRAVAVLALRADFYAAAAREPLLVDPLQHRCTLVAPLSRRELIDAVVGPAGVVGGRVDDGLPDVLLAELAPRDPGEAAHDPGALPLISHALLAAWDEQTATLRLARYRDNGGIAGGVRHSAEGVYSGLDADGRDATRRLFRRLVAVDDDGVATRWRFARVPATADDPLTASVIERFVAARLLTADDQGVEIAHEALLTAWPRLRDWAADDQERLHLHRQLAHAAAEWQEHERDDSLLLGAARVAATHDWTGADPLLDGLERDYLDRSREHQAARERVERGRSRRLRASLVTAVLLAVLAVVFGTLAVVSRHSADRQRDAAAHARDEALSRQGAVEATALRATDPSLARQLALAAYRISPTTEARSALLDSTAVPAGTRLLGASGQTQVTTLGPALFAAARGDGTVTLYATTSAGSTPEVVSTFRTRARPDKSLLLASGMDGHMIAVSDGENAVALWDVSRAARPRRVQELTLPAAGAISAVAMGDGAGGAELAVAVQQTLYRWRMQSGRDEAVRLPTLSGAGGPVQAVALDPTRSLVATGGQDGAVTVWSDADASTPRKLASTVLTTPTNFVLALAFGPDGTLAVGTKDHTVRLLRVAVLTARGAPTSATVSRAGSLGGFSDWVNSVAFSADGRVVAAADSDGTARAWDVATGRLITVASVPANGTSVAFTGGGSSLVIGEENGAVHVWPLPGPVLAGPQDTVWNLGFDGSGRALVAGSGPQPGEVYVWSAQDMAHPVVATTSTVQGLAPGQSFDGTASISPSGELIASGTGAGRVVLWRVVGGGTLQQLGGPLVAGTQLVEGTRFSPDGSLLAAGTDDHHVVLWNVSDPTRPRRVATLATGADPYFTTFSPSGHLLAVADGDFSVHVWDLTDPTRPRQLPRLTGFDNYVYSVGFSPDGRTIAAGSTDRTVRLWNVTDPARPTLDAVLRGPTNTVYSVSFSPDGTQLAAGSTDGSVWLWDVTRMRQPVHLATLTADTGRVDTVAFAPTGHVLAASGSEQAVRLWHTDATEVARHVCVTAGTPITRDEWRQYLPGTAYRPPCTG